MRPRQCFLCLVLCAAAGVAAGQTSSSAPAHDNGPDKAVVFRARSGAQPPAGLQDGDLITAVNGTPVHFQPDLKVFEGKDVSLACWRAGQGAFSLSLRLTPELRSACLPWPDRMEVYVRYGHQGPWTDKVLAGIRGTYANDAAAVPKLEEAWKQGCRDPMVAFLILRDCMAYGLLSDANMYWNDLIKGDKTSYPGGLYRYGLAPYCLTLLRLPYSQAKDLKADLEAWQAEAKQAGANRGASLLRAAEFIVLLQTSPSEALGFWKAHAPEIRQEQGQVSNYPLWSLIGPLQRLADPNAALELLNGEPPSSAREGLIAYFQRRFQARAAAKTAPLAAHWVLVDWQEAYGPLFADIEYRELVLFDRMPMPCRLEVETRITRSVKVPTSRAKSISIRMACPLMNEEADWISAAMYSTQQMDAGYMDRSQSNNVTLRLVDPNEWHRFALIAQADQFQVEGDGLSSGPIYRHVNAPPEVEPYFYVSGCTAEFRNVRFYVGSEQEADNAKIETALREFRAACRSDDLPAAKKATGDLQEILAPIAQAKEALGKRLRELAAQESIHSDNGLDLCTDDWLRCGLVEDAGWSFEQGVFSGGGGADDPLVSIPLPVGDVEITGEVELASAGKKTYAFVGWNSSGDRNIHPQFRVYPQSGKSCLLSPTGASDGIAAIQPGPIPFCIRTRGKTAVVFVASPTIPIARVADMVPSGDRLVLGGVFIPDSARVRFSKIRIRTLAKDKRIDAPASFKGASPSSQPGPGRDDSGDSGR